MSNSFLFEDCTNTFKKRVAIVHLNGVGLFSKAKLQYSVFLTSLFASIEKYGGSSKSGDAMLNCALDGGYSRSQFFKHIDQAEYDGYVISALRGFKNARVFRMTAKGMQLWKHAWCVILTSDKTLDIRRIYNAVNVDYAGEVVTKTVMAKRTGHSFRRIDYDPDVHRELWAENPALQRNKEAEIGQDKSRLWTGQVETLDRTSRDSRQDKSRLSTTTNHYNNNHYNISSLTTGSSAADKSACDTAVDDCNDLGSDTLWAIDEADADQPSVNFFDDYVQPPMRNI